MANFLSLVCIEGLMSGMNRKEQKKLERKLLTRDQLRELEAFDKAVQRSNQRFYNNCIIETDLECSLPRYTNCTSVSIDTMAPTVLGFPRGQSQDGGKVRCCK